MNTKADIILCKLYQSTASLKVKIVMEYISVC